MKRSSVKHNVLYQMLYEILVLCIPLITSPYISRILGAENLGIFSYTYSIAFYFGLVCMLGGKNHGNRSIAKCRDNQDEINKTFSNIYAVQLAVSLIVVPVYLIYCFNQTTEYRLYFLIEMIYVVSCLLDISWFFFGLEKFKMTVSAHTIVKLVTFISIFVFVQTKYDLWKYCLIIVGGTLMSQIILWTYLRRYAHWVKPNLKEAVKHAKPMFVLFVPVIAVSLYNVMDKIMVGSISTKTQLGFYENSEKIINCVKTVITSFGTVMLPRMSRLVAENDEKQSRRYLTLSVDAVMCVSFALAFGIAGVADIFAPVYWGREFSPCGILLIGLSVSLPFSALANTIRNQYMMPHSMDTAYIVAVVSGALVNIGANLLLIPIYGALGAVIATIFAEGLVCVVQCIYVRGKIPVLFYVMKSLPYLAIGFVMYMVVTLLNNTQMVSNRIITLLIEICVGGVAYLVMSFIYLCATKNELLGSFMVKFKKSR